MKRKTILIRSVLVEVALLAGAIFLTWLFYGLVPAGFILLLVLPVMALAGILMVYFWWAPNNLFFTFVPEGRAKVVVKGDAFQRLLVQWKGHSLKIGFREGADYLEDIWTLVGDEAETRGWFDNLFGGLKFYGFWPFEDIYIYDFSWIGLKQNGEPDPHEKETLDYALLKEDVYFVSVVDAEDKDLLPLTVQLVLSIRLVNPYKALFLVQNWLEAVISRIVPAVRDRLTEGTYGAWTESDTDLGQRIQDDLQSNNALQEFENQYGVKVRKVEVHKIDPPPEFREASLQQYLAEREVDRIKAVYGR